MSATKIERLRLLRELEKVQADADSLQAEATAEFKAAETALAECEYVLAQKRVETARQRMRSTTSVATHRLAELQRQLRRLAPPEIELLAQDVEEARAATRAAMSRCWSGLYVSPRRRARIDDRVRQLQEADRRIGALYFMDDPLPEIARLRTLLFAEGLSEDES